VARSAKFDWDDANTGGIRRAHQEASPSGCRLPASSGPESWLKNKVGYQTVIKTLLQEALKRESQIA